MSVLWNDASITRAAGRASRVVRLGAPGSSCHSPSASLIIAPGAVSVGLLTACEDAYSTDPTGVVTFFLGLPEYFNSYTADSTIQRTRRDLTGRRFELVLPVEAGGSRRDYLFKFVVDSVGMLKRRTLEVPRERGSYSLSCRIRTAPPGFNVMASDALASLRRRTSHRLCDILTTLLDIGAFKSEQPRRAHAMMPNQDRDDDQSIVGYDDGAIIEVRPPPHIDLAHVINLRQLAWLGDGLHRYLGRLVNVRLETRIK